MKGKKELADMQMGRRTLSPREYDMEEDFKVKIYIII